jgi:hypothetical protein
VISAFGIPPQVDDERQTMPLLWLWQQNSVLDEQTSVPQGICGTLQRALMSQIIPTPHDDRTGKLATYGQSSPVLQ